MIAATQTPAALLAQYTERAQRDWGSHALARMHTRAMGAAHALLACGLLTADEHAAGINRIADALAKRATELAIDGDSQGGDL